MEPWASSELPTSLEKRWLVPTVHQKVPWILGRDRLCSCHLHTGPLGTERGSSTAVLQGTSLGCTGVHCVSGRAVKEGASMRRAPALSAVLVRGLGGDREAV